MFLYANNELSEREMKKTVPFTTASRRIEHLGINVTKEVKDLYSENYKKLMTETGSDTNKWKYLSCSCIIMELYIKIMEELILLK